MHPIRIEAMKGHKGYRIAAVAILIGASLNELVRIVSGSPWPHVAAPLQSHVIGAVFSTIWLATALCLSMRRRSDTWYTASWLLGFAAVGVMLFHGAVLRLLGNLAPVLFMPLAVFLAFCIKQSFDPEETLAYRERLTLRSRRASGAH
jgi:hypothetical protein